MSGSGIIRRVDDLGRIVIPREVRRTLHISEGDPFEITVSGGKVILSKYDPASPVRALLRSLRAAVEDEPLLKCGMEVRERIAEIEALLKKEEDMDLGTGKERKENEV